MSHGMERAWALALQANTTSVAIGYDNGYVMVKLGREEPLASMDSGGKIVVAKNNEILQANIRAIPDEDMKDGEALPVALKSQCNCEVYPQELFHNPNGRHVVISCFVPCPDSYLLRVMASTSSTLHWHGAPSRLVLVRRSSGVQLVSMQCVRPPVK